MDKKKLASIINLAKEIEKKEGEGSIYSLGSKKATAPIPRWSTGIEDLDNILGGGMPMGRIIELFGAESSGKTTLGYHLASMCELSLNIPIEGTFNGRYAKDMGCNPKQMLVYRATYGEEAVDKMNKFGRAGVPLIILDSVPACLPKEEMELNEKDIEKNHRIGGVARLFARTLPTLNNIIEVSGTTVILINQIRDKMQTFGFGDTVHTPGGRAIKFYSSIRMQVARRAWIEVPNKDPRNSATKQRIGMIMKVRVIKSKVCDPMGECEIPIIFGRGPVSHDDVDVIRKEIMRENNRRYKK